MFKQPWPILQTTTLWDFPSQHYGDHSQGDSDYEGVTPSYIIWNLLARYTQKGDVVLDPMCGSGTTLDVCKDLQRKGLGFDLSPSRVDIKKADARKIPMKSGTVDFIFMDPPYGQHIRYSGNDACIGETDARDGSYYAAMEDVSQEAFRVLKDGGYLGIYVQDSFAKGKSFCPIGFEIFGLFRTMFEPVDIACVTRHNKSLKKNHWHTSALEGNYFLRGFNYLFVFRKNQKRLSSMLNHEVSGEISQFTKKALSLSKQDGLVLSPEDLSKKHASIFLVKKPTTTKKLQQSRTRSFPKKNRG